MENMDMMFDELITAVKTMDPAMLDAALTGLGFVLVAAIAYVIGRYLMRTIGLSAMYRKAGEAGWKAFIPVFNTYNNYKISWNGKLFFLYAALFVASTALGAFAEGAMGLVTGAISLAIVVLAVMQNIKMAKAFGKGVGTGIALILFPGITALILGLGKAEYVAIAE